MKYYLYCHLMRDLILKAVVSIGNTKRLMKLMLVWRKKGHATGLVDVISVGQQFTMGWLIIGATLKIMKIGLPWAMKDGHGQK